MDVVAHGLWAGAAGEWIRRRTGQDGRLVGWTVAFGIAPDVVQFVPVAAWSLSLPDPAQFLSAYIFATPGNEPALPPLIHQLSHHAHCALHSIVVAGIVTALAWWLRPALLLALPGWWLHIAIDMPTHSADYYAVPFLYPFSTIAVDGVAWTSPWMLGLNYALLLLAYVRMFFSGAKPGIPGAPPRHTSSAS